MIELAIDSAGLYVVVASPSTLSKSKPTKFCYVLSDAFFYVNRFKYRARW